jgi:hypothetical protein
MREKLTEELKSKSWRDIKKFVDGEEVCRWLIENLKILTFEYILSTTALKQDNNK